MMCWPFRRTLRRPNFFGGMGLPARPFFCAAPAVLCLGRSSLSSLGQGLLLKRFPPTRWQRLGKLLAKPREFLEIRAWASGFKKKDAEVAVDAVKYVGLNQRELHRFDCVWS